MKTNYRTINECCGGCFDLRYNKAPVISGGK